MVYTLADGLHLGEVIDSQYPFTTGISTRKNQDGTWDLTAWPTGLGPRPTQNDVDTWAAALPARIRDAKRAAVKAALRGNDPETIRLRAVVKVLLGSLVQARRTCNELRAAMVNATSLADLKTRATAVTALVNRDFSQALAAADAMIDAGQGEEP